MIESIASKLPAVGEKKVDVQGATKELVNTFSQVFDEVNEAQLNANDKMAELTTGKSKDIHGTMIAIEKADVSLRILMAVREKMVNAYNEVMRMQV